MAQILGWVAHDKETSSQREAKLKKVAEQVRLLHRERDNALKNLKMLWLKSGGRPLGWRIILSTWVLYGKPCLDARRAN